MMLNLREDQMEALGRAGEETFVTRMADHLRRDFPAELQRHGIAPAQVEDLVRRGMADARGYGVEYEADLQLYLECLLLLGPAFDRDPQLPWARAILTRGDLDGAGKMDQIDEALLFALGEPR